MQIKEEDFDEYCDNEYDSDPSAAQLECELCLKTFRTMAGLSSHLRTHEAELDKMHECNFCGLKLQPAIIISHMQQHSAENEWEFAEVCPANGCRRKFKLKSQLDAHAVQHAPVEYICQICQKQYSSRKNLREHEKLHGDRNFHCGLCGRSFTEQRRLNEHMKSHTKRETEKLVCPVCSKLFSTRNNLREHEKLHGEKNFQCTECGGKFAEQRRLNEHMKIHGERNYPCDQCEKAFTTECRLREHIKYHSVGLQFACEHCDEVFRLQNSLQKHIRRNHDTAYAFHCKHCGKGFIMQSDCNAHEECHSNELKHTCSECNKQFNTVKNLRNHMAVHFVEKTIACPAEGCGKMFRNQRDCRRHNETVHEKLWKCEICARCCSSGGQLKKHIQNVHADPLAEGEDKKQRRQAIEALEKPLVCGFQGCKIRFQDEHRLAIHRLRHNNTVPMPEATPNFVVTEVGNSYSDDSTMMTGVVKQEPVGELAYPVSVFSAPPPMQMPVNPYAGYTFQNDVEQELDDHVANRLRALEELRNFHGVRNVSEPVVGGGDMVTMGHEANNFNNAMTVVHFNPRQ
jgi:uncharacterized Zn-finger protein